ncbi:endonuclease [Pseudofulvibacter geojedonensis]|uniref:Endonuclease n=1 Tax=Pseudofulvibacter geojedonensis TaxID=1123758 RepID=A0ABW3HYV4_9FLAO
MKKIFLVLFLLPLLVVAQIPNYYNGIDFSLTGDALKAELSNLITNTHTTELPYTSSLTDTWDVLRQTDLNPNNTSEVLLLYGYDDLDAVTKNDSKRDKNLSCHVSSCIGLWNREHVYAKSLATPSLQTDDPGAGTDIHSLRSCDGQMNSSRNNRPYESGSGNAGITNNGNWYPGDEWKGDVARMMMYIYVRYPSQCLATNVGVGSASYSNFGDMPNIFLDWNEQDPVSQYERNRNDVLEGIQGNRNPFIDNPYLATIIWNGPIATDTWAVLSSQDVWFKNVFVYPTLTEDYVYIEAGNKEEFVYYVYNTLGQLIKSGSTDYKINLSNQLEGMYFIKLTLGGAQEKTFRIFVK